METNSDLWGKREEPCQPSKSTGVMITVDINSISKTTGRIAKEEVLSRSVGAVMGLGLPSVARLVNKYSGTLIIAGGAPSLSQSLPQIRHRLRMSKKAKLMAINRTYDHLVGKGFCPDFCTMIDPKAWVSRYVSRPQPQTKFLLGAKCDISVFERLKGQQIYVWHPLELKEEPDALRAAGYDEWIAIPGHSTTGLRCVPLGYELGFRDFELHGMDCSHDLTTKDGTRGNGHAYEKYSEAEHKLFQPEADLGRELIRIKTEPHGTRYFEASKHMARQLGEWDVMMGELDKLYSMGLKQFVRVRVAGTGALPYFAAVKFGIHVEERYNKDPNSMAYVKPQEAIDFEKEQATAGIKGMSNLVMSNDFDSTPIVITPEEP